MKKQKKAKEPKGKKTKAPKTAKRGRGAKIAAISIVSVAAVLVLVMLVGAMTVNGADTILPNVSLQGLDLSGLTKEQAVETIRSAGLDSGAAEVLSVTLPGSVKASITAADTGYHSTAQEAAEAAYAYGHDSNILTNFFTWLHARVAPMDLADTLCGDRDTASIRSKAEAATAEANRFADSGSFEIDEEASELLIVKGASSSIIDAETVYDFIIEQLDAHVQEAEFTQPTDGEPTIDMQALHDSVCGDPINAHYDNETQEIVEGKPGVAFDVAEAQKLWDEAEVGDTVHIPVTLTPASFGAGDVSELYADLLASKSTSLGGSSANRVNNITLAAQHIDGVVLQPGESFSYNNTVGQRTTANGFKESGAYANGQVVSEVGGGICQVSSTLYYCTMVANLQITSRTNHYFSVGYIEPGMDATVSWGSPDFVFVNSRTFPIRIHAYVSGVTITVEIWGTDVDGSYVKMESAVGGLNVTTYRCVYAADGTLISREQEATSTYHTHDTAPKATPAPSTTQPSNPSTPAPVQTPTPATPAPVQTPTPVVPQPEPVPDPGGGGDGGDGSVVL
ncbi:MAG: VanW family protein [Oscillospiraceae bacterium]|nr:VanW family protein [Oscillospiraceae bacterium]